MKNEVIYSLTKKVQGNNERTWEKSRYTEKLENF